jgi:4-hydroxy-tetrahydrodipicolinate reductase
MVNNKNTQVCIVGYGKVGMLVAECVQSDENLILSYIVDRSHASAASTGLTPEILKNTDVIIDFSNGGNVLEIVNQIVRHNPNVRIVTGSSGWNSEEQLVRDLVLKHKLYFLSGANFAIGTALFMKVVNYAAELFNQFQGFDPSLLDIHHRHKKDMPSGTAKKIAQNLVDRFDSKDSVVFGIENRAICENELHVASLRNGENMGFHELTLDSPEEVIKISQQTRDRAAYARGSIEAAKWLIQQEKPGLYTFDDYINKQL